MYFSYDNLQFRYDPFPIGIAKPIMDEEVYNSFLNDFPPLDLFLDYRSVGKYGNKFTLSEKEDERRYRAFVRSSSLWREFYRWIKSDDFIYGVLNTLRDHYIDLGYVYTPPVRRLAKRIKEIRRGRFCSPIARLKSRFEFSALPADGGEVVPHTDASSKLVTIILAMVGKDEWQASMGGGTDVNRPKRVEQSFNRVNRLAEFDDMDVVDTYEFDSNQAVIFVRTYNSWHSVRPMRGTGSPLMRKTLTIVIEKD